MIDAPSRPDIAIRLKPDHVEAALQILRAKGHHPVETTPADNGSVLVRFGRVGDDLCYAIAASLPLEYYDLRGTLDNG